MDENHNRPISRGDLLFTVEFALWKAERFWPKKFRPAITTGSSRLRGR